jgi:hypothetical protein
MSTPIKLGVFALGLIVVFAAAFGVGRLVDPATTPAAAAERGGDAHDGTGGHDEKGGHDGKGGQDEKAATNAVPGGLQISQDGYRLEPVTRVLSTSDSQPFSFRIIGPDGKPLTAYATEHEKELHLIVVRRDLTGFQHLHPARDASGVWSVPLSVREAGAYRMFADFRPAARDQGLILGADLTAPGDYHPRQAGPVSRSTVVGAYTVSLEGDLVPGTASKLTLTVTRAGVPVTDLEPYLAAFGHLVALRDGDLAYLHVHPEESTEAGPRIVFYAEVPSAGIYGLFLDFQHAGTVHTAQFTATAGEVKAPTPTASHGH